MLKTTVTRCQAATASTLDFGLLVEDFFELADRRVLVVDVVPASSDLIRQSNEVATLPERLFERECDAPGSTVLTQVQD